MSLSDHIAPNEILTSGQLAQRLTTTGLTPAAARQVISRSNDPAVWPLPLRLPRRSRLFVLRDSIQNDAFYHNLAAVIDDLRPGLARTILALSKRQILLRADAQRLLAAPLLPKSSRTPTYGAEVDTLVALRLCSVEGSNTALERLTIKSLAGLPISHQLARSERVRQIVDRYLTRMITDQLRKQGVIGWNSATLADLETGSVRFSDYVFSAFGYSWLDPLVRRAVGQRPKPVPVLFDVCARECDVHDVQGLLHRLARIGSNRNARMSVLGVIAAYVFTDDAWLLAKNAVYWRSIYGSRMVTQHWPRWRKSSIFFAWLVSAICSTRPPPRLTSRNWPMTLPHCAYTRTLPTCVRSVSRFSQHCYCGQKAGRAWNSV